MDSSIAVGERIRTYTVVGEERGPAGRALVLVFHGSRQNGHVHRRFTGGALDRLAADGDAVVAYLDGHRGNWNDLRRGSYFPARQDGADDVAFARAAVARLEVTHGIERARVVAMGYSNGGQMVMRLLHEAPELASAAVIVAAGMPVPENLLLADPLPATRPVPVAVVHGTADPIVPYSGGEMKPWMQRMFRACGATMSAPDTAAYFAARNGIADAPVTHDLPVGADEGRRVSVTRSSHRAAGRPDVDLYTVRGGGHTVPPARPGPRIVGRTARSIDIGDLVRRRLPPRR